MWDIVRSSTLTGKYTHNHHTYENNVERGCNAQSWRDQNEKKTVGYYMSMAGYKTGFFGVYIICIYILLSFACITSLPNQRMIFTVWLEIIMGIKI